MKKILLFSIISLFNSNILSYKPNVLLFKSIRDLLNSTCLVTEYILKPERRLELENDVKDLLYTAYWVKTNTGLQTYIDKQGQLLQIPNELLIKMLEQSPIKDVFDITKLFLEIAQKVKFNTKPQEEIILSKTKKQAYRVYVPKTDINTYQKEISLFEDFLNYMAKLKNNKELRVDMPQLIKDTMTGINQLNNIADYITILNALNYNLNKDPDITLSHDNIDNILKLKDVFKDKLFQTYMENYPKKVDEFSTLCKSLNIPTEIVLRKQDLNNRNGK